MIDHLKVSKLPVEFPFNRAASIYFKRLLVLLAVSAQCWLIMIVLIGALLLTRTHPVIAAVIMCTGLVAVALWVNVLIYQKFSIRRVKTPEDVDEYLKLTTLAVIPNLRNYRSKPRLYHDRSPLAESYRHLRSSLMLSKSGQPPKTILITSSVASEGVTTTAVNTAVMMAKMGVDVLLIDCNLRRPRLHGLLHLSNDRGLSNLLAGMPGPRVDADADRGDNQRWKETAEEVEREVLRRSRMHPGQSSEAADQKLAIKASLSGLKLIRPNAEFPKLCVMPSGPLPPSPSELLGSQTMQALLEVLSERFSHIILDSPPAGLFTDAAILSTFVEGVVLVVNSGETAVLDVERTKRLLLDVGANILGVVLNGFNVEESSYYYSGYYRLEEDKELGNDLAADSGTAQS